MDPETPEELWCESFKAVIETDQIKEIIPSLRDASTASHITQPTVMCAEKVNVETEELVSPIVALPPSFIHASATLTNASDSFLLERLSTSLEVYIYICAMFCGFVSVHSYIYFRCD